MKYIKPYSLYEAEEVGWQEWCIIPDLGRFLAKLDTGNGTKASSLGVDSIEIDGDLVYWNCNGKDRVDSIKDWSLAKVGDTIDKRPIIILDIELGPHRLSEVPIALTDRSAKSTQVLINRGLLSRLGVTVAPNREFLLGESSLPDPSRLAELGLLDGPFITWELTATPRSWIESNNPDIGKFTLHEADGETHWTIYLSSFRESGSDLVAWATSQLHQQGRIPNWQETPIWQELLSAVQDQMNWVALKYVARAWPSSEPGALLPAQCLNTGEWHWLKRPALPPAGW